uniref:C2H2-type domain-containing protein n=1 Tax=Globodera rostochiensis TaxID=31243 RepID=A0A914HXZ6_GLORO
MSSSIGFMPSKSPVFGSLPPIASDTAGNDSSDSDAVLLVQQHNFPDRKTKAKFGCPNCSSKFMSMEMLDLHQNNCHRRRRASPSKASATDRRSDAMCDVCDKLCASPKGVAIHKCKAHKTGKEPVLLNCSVCDYRAKFPSTLKIHQRSHNRNNSSSSVNNSKRRAVAESSPPSVCRRKSTPKEAPAVRTVHATEFRHHQRSPSKHNNKQPPSTAGGGHRHEYPMRDQSQSLGGTSSSTKMPNSAMGNGAKKQQQQRGMSCGGHGGRNNATETDDDDDDIMLVDSKPTINQRHNLLIPRNKFGAVDPIGCAAGSAVISHYAGMVINACSQSNLVTFHDVDTTRGAIGKITFQFMCNSCRGERGVARCYRGRAYCVVCCGHAECD